MEDTRKFDDYLFSPAPGTDPDRVPAEVARNELAAFAALQRETS